MQYKQDLFFDSFLLSVDVVNVKKNIFPPITNYLTMNRSLEAINLL